jgi:hypothetical protein
MIGTGLIYFFGVPRQADTGGVVFLALEGDQGIDRSELGRIKKYKRRGNAGLALVFLAFLLQLISLVLVG